jgi:hypothetical protein
MRTLMFVATMLGLAGCSSMDKQMTSRFEPIGPGEFRFEAEAGIDKAEGSQSAEAERRTWIEEYVRDNRVCGNGYNIVERKPVLVRQALLGPVHRIYYRGRCK